MKILRHMLFTLVAVIGLTFSVSAQRDDQKRPPKDPPAIKPGDKVKPRETPQPRGGDKPKKPEMAAYMVARELNTEELL